VTPDPRRARLESLLATEATQGLTPAETDELDTLLAAFPDEDPDGFELAAAAVHLALVGSSEKMPSRLAEKLHLATMAFTPPAAPTPRRAGRPAWATWTGWAVAASLAGLLLYTNWPKKPVGPEVTQKPDEPKPPEVKREPTLAERRAEMLKDKTAKAATFDEAKAETTASVVWSGVRQEGYLEVRGLPPNDPTKEQYQLWIMDAAQKQPVPVDGGVFDVKPDGTATFAVRSPIRVSDAQAFAISKEKPGGGPQPAGQIVLVLKPKVG
jgi:hypothetical protein